MTENPRWHIESPGRMVLPGTLYAITWNGHASPVVHWNGRSIGCGGTIEDAKEYATWHAGQLMAVGLDPTDAEPMP